MSVSSLPPLSSEDLWAMPRVGAPALSPDGARFVVPVTRYDMAEGEGRSRLWLIGAGASKAGDGGKRDSARALTEEGYSSRAPVWSPEGERLLFLRKPGTDAGEHANQEQLHLMDMAGREVERLTDMPLGVADPRWFPDGRRIAFIARVLHEAPTPEGSAQLLGELTESPLRVRVTENRLYRYWDHWLDEDRCHHIFVLDLDSGELVDLTPDSRRWFDLMDPTGQYDIAPDGLEIAYSACASAPPHDPIRWGVFTVKLPARGASGKIGKPQELGKRYAGGALRPRYSPDGKCLLYGMRREPDFYADRLRLVARNRESKRDLVLTEGWDRSATGWCFDNDGQVLMLAEESGRSALFAFDFEKALANRQAEPRELCRGGSFASLVTANGRVLLNHSSLTEAPEVMQVLKEGKLLKRVTGFTLPIISHRRIGKVEDRLFAGASNKPVQMFLVRPPGRATHEKKPLLHLIHGGPHGNFGDQWHWRWNAQVFAAGSGAICACVNFHGSTGWGQNFAASILGRWGEQPYEDIMAATDLLIEEELVDPERMAAAGGSYGGYLIAWLAARTRRFACLVDHAGVNDLQAQYASDWTQGRRRSLGGEPWDNLEGLDRYNPMRQASGFGTPLLVLHGEQDYRVPYSQGLAIYNVYKAMGLPARLVVYPDENHWILKPANSVHWYGEILAWLDRWLTPPTEESEE
jgi:dipeptidyl aminopeptidase/acylaminoacyl peptidase